MFEINGIYYVLNLSKINSYIFETQNKENIDVETTDQFNISNNNPIRTSREIKSVKTNGNINVESMKYDMFKDMLSILFNSDLSNDWQNLLPNEKIVLSHVPLPDKIIPENYLNIHGHIHNNPLHFINTKTGEMEYPIKFYSEKLHICVSADVIDFKPISLDKILKRY